MYTQTRNVSTKSNIEVVQKDRKETNSSILIHVRVSVVCIHVCMCAALPTVGVRSYALKYKRLWSKREREQLHLVLPTPWHLALCFYHWHIHVHVRHCTYCPVYLQCPFCLLCLYSVPAVSIMPTVSNMPVVPAVPS